MELNMPQPDDAVLLQGLGEYVLLQNKVQAIRSMHETQMHQLEPGLTREVVVQLVSGTPQHTSHCGQRGDIV